MPNTLGEQLHILRSRKGLSQAELAARCAELGVSGCLQHVISRWERNTHQPSAAQLEAILRATEAGDDDRLLALQLSIPGNAEAQELGADGANHDNDNTEGDA